MPNHPSNSPTPASLLDASWRCGSPEECLWFDCDDAFVVYHRPSGKTHLMNDVSAYLLRDLLVEPMRLLDVVVALSPDSTERSVDFEKTVAEMLIRFEQLGLVERA